MALISLGTMAVIVVVAVVFVVVGLLVAPRHDPRRDGRAATLTLEDLEDDESS